MAYLSYYHISYHSQPLAIALRYHSSCSGGPTGGQGPCLRCSWRTSIGSPTISARVASSSLRTLGSASASCQSDHMARGQASRCPTSSDRGAPRSATGSCAMRSSCRRSRRWTRCAVRRWPRWERPSGWARRGRPQLGGPQGPGRKTGGTSASAGMMAVPTMWWLPTITEGDEGQAHLFSRSGRSGRCLTHVGRGGSAAGIAVRWGGWAEQTIDGLGAGSLVELANWAGGLVGW